MRPTTILDAVPDVEPTPGLMAVFEFEPGTTETYHRGDWYLVTEIQAGPPDPETGEPRVYLRLGSERRTVTVPKIDRATGQITNRVFDLHAGPEILTGASVLRRARHRSILEIDVEGVTP